MSPVKWNGGTINTISLLLKKRRIKKKLKHCGKWKEPIPKSPPQTSTESASVAEEVTLDYDFFKQKLHLNIIFKNRCLNSNRQLIILIG
jgi:hypothetical protein